MEKRITYSTAPPLGDVRAMGAGDTLWIHANAEQRKDWARFADAIACAVSRGCEVRRRWGM